MTAAQQSDYLQLSVELPPTMLELWEAALVDVGALSITCRDAEDNPVFEPGPGEIVLWDSLKLTALFAQGASKQGVIAALQKQNLPVDDRLLHFETLPDQQWERAWLDDFAPLQFGERLWICPLEIEPPAPTAVNLRLDPGLAFGTGTHPTTAMCLRWLDANEVVDARVIDYGCGSGVLGIAALLLGAKHVVATDIDPQALQATVSNAAINRVDDCLESCLSEWLSVEPAGLVIANILAAPLIALADTLATLCEPGGRLVLSGMLGEQVDEVWRAYAVHFCARQVMRDGEWACLSATRRAV